MGTVTVNVRSLVTGLLVLLALLVGYLVAGGSGGGTAAVAADDKAATEPVPQLTMNGTGTAAAVPDELSFSLSVHVTRPDLGDALDAANGTVSRVLAAVADHGVTRRDVQTTGLSTTAVYDYHPYDPPTLRGYRVTERASVHVRDLHDGGAAVSAAVAAGGNDVSVGTLKLLVGDDDAVLAQARAAAVAEAKAKAQEYADAAGERLGQVVTISEVTAKPVPTPVVGVRAVRGAAAYDQAIKAMPVRAGREQASVTVRVVWLLR